MDRHVRGHVQHVPGTQGMLEQKRNFGMFLDLFMAMPRLSPYTRLYKGLYICLYTCLCPCLCAVQLTKNFYYYIFIVCARQGTVQLTKNFEGRVLDIGVVSPGEVCGDILSYNDQYAVMTDISCNN